MDQTFRERFPSIVEQEQVNWIYDHADINKASGRFSQIHGQDQDNIRPKTLFIPLPPTFITDKMDYSKSYHLVKGEEGNIDGNFMEHVDYPNTFLTD